MPIPKREPLIQHETFALVVTCEYSCAVLVHIQRATSL